MIGFVVNPVSGNGRGMKNWRIVETALKEKDIPYKVKFTKAALEAEQFAIDFAGNPAVTSIAAVGGDGTVHEAANGLFKAGGSKPLGYIPAGSGNDFARGFGLPTGTEDALQVILGPHHLRAADVIHSEGKIAICSTGAGFDGKVARVTNTAVYKNWLNKLKLGKLAYVISLVRVLVSYRPCEAKITVDGVDHGFNRVWLITFANIPYFGGGMKICPDADPGDGTASICVVSGIGKLELLAVFPRVYKGTHISHPAVHFLQGRRITLHSVEPLDIHMDGEAAGTTPVHLEVMPAAISVIVP